MSEGGRKKELGRINCSFSEHETNNFQKNKTLFK